MASKFEGVVITEADVQAISRTAFSSLILFVVCHAFHTCIFGAALYYIVANKGGTRRRFVFASIVTFLWMVETIIVAFQWDFVDDAFGFCGRSATTSTEARFNKFRDGLAGTIASFVLRGLSAFLADSILIWHCYMLYGRSWKVASLPSLCLGFETILLSWFLSRKLQTLFQEPNWVKWVMICYSMTVLTNGLCTSLILSRIVWVTGVSASLRTYGGIIEIFIQSAALYSAVQVAVLGVYAYEFYAPEVRIVFRFIYPQVLSCSITGIAPTLIIARIMAGKGRPNDSSTRPSLPHLRSDMLSVTEAIRFASGPPHDAYSLGQTTDIALEEVTRIIGSTSGEEIYAPEFEAQGLGHKL